MIWTLNLPNKATREVRSVLKLALADADSLALFADLINNILFDRGCLFDFHPRKIKPK